MSAVHRTLHQFHTGVELCRLSLVIIKAQVWIAADLPQPCQLGKHLHLVPVKIFIILLCQHFLHMHYLRIISCLLRLVKFDITHFLELVRKVF